MTYLHCEINGIVPFELLKNFYHGSQNRIDVPQNGWHFNISILCQNVVYHIISIIRPIWQ